LKFGHLKRLHVHASDKGSRKNSGP
jgi:hypothetical protein